MSKKQIWGLLLVLGLSSVILWYELKDLAWQSIVAALRHFNFGFFIVALLVMSVSFVTDALIFYILESEKGKKRRNKLAFFRVPAMQALFNAITPFASGGQPAQLVALIQMGVEGGRATSILLMKFIIFQFVVLASYLVTMLFGFSLVAQQFSGLLLLIIIGFIVHTISIIFLLFVMFKYDWTKNLLRHFFNFIGRFFNPEKVASWQRVTLAKVDNFYREGMQLKKQKSKLLLSTLLTIVDRLAFYSVPYFVLLAFGVQANYFMVLTLNVMITMIISIIPIPGGSGGAEFSFKSLFAMFLSNQSALILAMFVWRFLTYFYGMILGLVALLIRPKKS